MLKELKQIRLKWSTNVNENEISQAKRSNIMYFFDGKKEAENYDAIVKIGISSAPAEV